jgi:ribosome biogenesis protein MAK21
VFLRACSLSRTHLDQQPKLAKDIAKFIKSLQIPKSQSEWTVDDEVLSEGDSSGNEDNEEQTNHPPPPVTLETIPTKGKAPKYVCTKLEDAKLNSDLFCIQLFPPTPYWYSALPPLQPNTLLQAPSESTITSLSTHAEALLKQDVNHYSHTESSSDAKFLSRVLHSGTLSDQLSALTLMVQASPLHNQKALEGLKSMAGKKSRSESLKALRAIVDWWVGGGSPDRKLK